MRCQTAARSRTGRLRGGPVPGGDRCVPGRWASPGAGVGRMSLETGAPVVPIAPDRHRGRAPRWRIRPRKVRIRAGRRCCSRPWGSPLRPSRAAVTDRIWAASGCSGIGSRGQGDARATARESSRRERSRARLGACDERGRVHEWPSKSLEVQSQLDAEFSQPLQRRTCATLQLRLLPVGVGPRRRRTSPRGPSCRPTGHFERPSASRTAVRCAPG